MITLAHGSIVIQDADRWLRDGAVAYDDETIEAVGPWEELRACWPEAPVLGGAGRLVMPGLANAHDHGRGVSTWERGISDGVLETWRYEQVGLGWPSAYWQALSYGLQMLRTGVTTLVHHQMPAGAPGTALEANAAALRAYRELGLRVCFAVGVWDQQRLVYGPEGEFLAGLPPELAAKVREYFGPVVSLDETAAVVRELRAEAKGSRVQVYFGPAGAQWCSEALLLGVKRAADALDTGLHMHLLETVYQRMWADRVLGRPLVQALDEWGIVDERLTVAHAVWLADSEMALLGQRGACLSHNPSSNLRLRSGIARVPALLERGVTVGIGLDGMGFREQDLFAEMRLALVLGSPPGLDTPALDARAVWRLATQGGTRAALGRDDLGVLEPGRPADLVVLDMERLVGPYPAVEHDPVELVIWRGRPELVETVVVGGETLVVGGEPVRANPAGCARELNAELAALGGAPSDEGWRRELVDHIRAYYDGWGPPAAAGLAPGDWGLGPAMHR